MSDGISEAWAGTYFRDRSIPVTEYQYRLDFLDKPTVIWFTGLPQSGKSTIAQELNNRFADEDKKCFVLDGDTLRKGLCSNLGFATHDRMENIRRAAEVAKIIYNLGYSVFAAFLTPSRMTRDIVKEIIPDVKFIYVDTPLHICEERDDRGMYKLAREGNISNFTGVNAPFEVPENPWMTITSVHDLKTISDEILIKLKYSYETV